MYIKSIGTRGNVKMQNDPVANYYMLGYNDLKDSRKVRRVPYNYKLVYLHGRSDAREGKEPYYNNAVDLRK